MGIKKRHLCGLALMVAFVGLGAVPEVAGARGSGTATPLSGHDPVENIVSRTPIGGGGCGGVAYSCPAGYMIQWSGGFTCGLDQPGYRLPKNIKASDTNGDHMNDTLVIQCVDQGTMTMQGAPVVIEGPEFFNGCYLHDKSVQVDVACRKVKFQ